MPLPRALVLAALSLAPLLLASPAGAQPPARAPVVVHVEVTDRGAETADAWVTLTPRDGGEPHSCITRSGTCDISDVPPGSYVVTATPRGEGRPPLPRVVPVPAGVPSVEVRVRLL